VVSALPSFDPGFFFFFFLNRQEIRIETT